MLDTQGSFLTKEDAFFGTFTLVNFLRVAINKPLLDDVLEALGGDAELFMDTALARLEESLNTPETVDNTVSTYANIFIVLDSVHVIDHPRTEYRLTAAWHPMQQEHARAVRLPLAIFGFLQEP